VKSHNRQIQFQANEQTTTRSHINAEKNIKLAILQQGSKSSIITKTTFCRCLMFSNNPGNKMTTCPEKPLAWKGERERERESHDIIQQNFN